MLVASDADSRDATRLLPPCFGLRACGPSRAHLRSARTPRTSPLALHRPTRSSAEQKSLCPSGRARSSDERRSDVPLIRQSHAPDARRATGTRYDGSNLNVVSGLDSKSDVSVGMNPWTGPRTRLERAGPRSGPAPSQTRRSGCRVPGHTPSVSTRGVGSADYPPVRIFAAIGTWRGELEERRSHKPGETFSRPNPTLSTPVFVNLRGASRDLPDQRSEFPMRGACRDPTQIHCVEHLASAG